jgi:hypothetical protein
VGRNQWGNELLTCVTSSDWPGAGAVTAVDQHPSHRTTLLASSKSAMPREAANSPHKESARMRRKVSEEPREIVDAGALLFGELHKD